MSRQQEGSRDTRGKSFLHMTKSECCLLTSSMQYQAGRLQSLSGTTQATAVSAELRIYSEVGLWEHGLEQQSQEGLWGAGHRELNSGSS